MINNLDNQHKNIGVKKPSRKRPDSTPLSTNLKRIMRDRSISMRVLAGMANVSVSTISDWLNNSTPSDLQKVYNLSKGLGVPFSLLVLGITEDNIANEMTIDDLYESVDTPIEGVFRISAQRLVKKQKK